MKEQNHCDTCLNQHTDKCNHCMVTEYHGQRVSNPTNYEQKPCETSTDEPMTMVYPTIFCDDTISRESIHRKLASIMNDHPLEGYEDEQLLLLAVEDEPPVQPSRKGHWIDVKEQMPEPLQSVIVTWKNHDPEPYYSDIKDKPFTGVAIYYKDKWWWWSAYTEDMLAEYGRSNDDEVDDAIEITAWMPLPKACEI